MEGWRGRKGIDQYDRKLLCCWDFIIGKRKLTKGGQISRHSDRSMSDIHMDVPCAASSRRFVFALSVLVVFDSRRRGRCQVREASATSRVPTHTL